MGEYDRYHKEEFLVLHDYPKEEVYGNSQVYDNRTKVYIQVRNQGSKPI